MKREVLRLSNAMIRRGHLTGGPFFIRLVQGGMTGVVIDESFEKELITDFFSGKSELVDGYFFYRERVIPSESRNTVIRKKLMKEIAVITDESRLFPSLSLIDNMFLPAFQIRTPRHSKIARELMEFFELNIPLDIKTEDLTPLQRIQVEILHAVTNRRKLIFVMHINGGLRRWEQEELYRLYDRLLSTGYAICLFESLSAMPLERLDIVSVVEKGMCVGEYLRHDIDRDILTRLVNTYGETKWQSEMLLMRDRRLYSGVRLPVLTLEKVRGGSIGGLSLCAHRGEIIELHCRRRRDYEYLRSYLVGQTDAADGRLIFREKDLTSREVRKLISSWRIGVVDLALIDQMLFENLSLLENVCYPLCRRVPGFFLRKNCIRAAEEYLSRIAPDLTPWADVCSLTQEQTVRAVFCRWVLSKPEVLYVFVPSSFARIEFDTMLNRLLLELSMYGIPILLISERYKLEAEVIESSCILDEGEVKNN